MKPLVAVDADVLGRRRTGDETYVERLLDALPRVEDGLRFAAITRRPEPGQSVVIPHGADPVFGPGARSDSSLLFVGAIGARKNPLAALAAAQQVGLPLVVAGPARARSLARALVKRGADVRGFVSKDELAELYRGAAVFVFPTRYEG